MATLPAARGSARAIGRPLVAGLFLSSCLLSLVSWYTTEQGMALYLSPWFALVASLGVQSALVLVAWLVGVSEARRGVLTSVYLITACVSIAFSYASLYRWFAGRERPAQVERRLYDALTSAAGRAEPLLTAAVAEAQQHALALDEMAAAEKAHGFISRATDSDPWLARVREAVAHEAASYEASYPEGAGAGLRYTAFDRYARLARETLERLRSGEATLARLHAELRPLDSSEQQLRAFRQVWDALPWGEARDTLHSGIEIPSVPAYSDFVDHTASDQEDLLIAMSELVTAPSGRNLLAFTLAGFIDLVVFLLAYAAGPLFFGAPEERWVRAAAALDGQDEQVFVRGLLRKTSLGPEGLPRLEADALSAGERQLGLLLHSNSLAAVVDDAGRHLLLDADFHRRLVEALAEPGLPLRAAKPAPVASPAS
jgi:hypothetical protein